MVIENQMEKAMENEMQTTMMELYSIILGLI